MSLINSFEKNGNELFRYRGQIPMLLFLVVIPVLYYTSHSKISNEEEFTIKLISILVCALGLAIRILTVGTAADFTSGRNRDKQVAGKLNTTGIYSIVRHPLYLGNYLMWAGIMIYTLNFTFFIIISLLFWIYYERIMFAEERFLERKFGNDFVNWSGRTPAFIPAFKKYIPTQSAFSWRKAVKEYSGIFAAVISFIFIQTLQDFFINKRWVFNSYSLIVLCVTLLVVIILKFFVQPRLNGNINNVITDSISEVKMENN